MEFINLSLYFAGEYSRSANKQIIINWALPLPPSVSFALCYLRALLSILSEMFAALRRETIMSLSWNCSRNLQVAKAPCGKAISTTKNKIKTIL